MTERRPMGGLENEVMAHLWTSGSPATPADVHRAAAPDLAYTTIMTVLTRLWDKGILERERKGRAYVYTPVRTEAEHRAAEMELTLDGCGDRHAVLESFLRRLGTQDRRQLRTLLDQS